MSLKGKLNAWIKPSGQFIPVDYMGHNKYAQEYFIEKYGRMEAQEKIKEICGSSISAYPYVALHKLGWIRILTWSNGKTRGLGNCASRLVTDNTMDPTANKKQLETLMEWCRDNNFNYSDLFKY